MPYDTRLSPEQEVRFQAWARSVGRERDTEDYDLRGAWLSGAFSGDGHGPDTYKKPNHPTFSNESIYSEPSNEGGRWVPAGDGTWVFWASPTNMRHNALGDLLQYFKDIEAGNTIVFPFDYQLPKRP